MTRRRNPPHLYTQPGSNWWWFSWSGPDGRVRTSCQALGLSLDVSREIAIERVKHYLDITSTGDRPAESLGWFREAFRTRPEPNIAGSTRALYLRGFDLLIAHLGPEFPLREVRRIPHVARLQDHLLRLGLSTVYINITCRSIQAVFKRAFELGYIDANPFARFPRLREPEHRLKHLEPDDLDRFLAAMSAWIPTTIREYHPPVWYDGMKRLMIIYLYTARRLSEPLALRREDIDLDAGVMYIVNAKTRGRKRDMVAIPPAVIDHFRWFLDTYPGERPFAAYRSYTVEKYCKLWLRLAGLPKDLHLHNLRHTSISLAANAPDANLRAVQQFVGHSSITMTEKYVHGRSRGAVSFGRDFTIQNDDK